MTCGGEGQKNCELLEQGLRFRGRHSSAENGGGLLMDERWDRGGPVRPEPGDDVSSNSIGSDTASRFPFRTGNPASPSAEELDDPSESLRHPDRAGRSQVTGLDRRARGHAHGDHARRPRRDHIPA